MAIFRKKTVIALVPTFINGFQYNHINVGYDNILSKFNFQVAGRKVKVTLIIFRKKTLLSF